MVALFLGNISVSCYSMSAFENLASRLENSCSLDEVENGVPLLGALLADEVPNIGGIKGALRTTWKDVGTTSLITSTTMSSRSEFRRKVFRLFLRVVRGMSTT